MNGIFEDGIKAEAAYWKLSCMINPIDSEKFEQLKGT